MLILLAPGAGSAQQRATVHGTVLDPHALPISGAEINYSPDTGARTGTASGATNESSTTTTNAKGEFTLADVILPGSLVARQAGFGPVTISLREDSARSEIQIQMTPAPAMERIEVTSNGGERIPETPASQFSISADAIAEAGSLALDDVLRQAPGFSLFRRSGSLFANPTTQGVSLRGTGASGASRADVLLDGIPLNDPFGGWVYWNQVPRASVEKVEVTNGGASDMYGGGALGGVVNLESRAVRNSFATAEMSYGNENTPLVSFDAGTRFGKWGISAAAQSLRGSGYILVPANQRGSVDTPAGTSDATGTLQLTRRLGDTGDFFFRGNSFGESRRNGTPVQTNNTRFPSLHMGLNWTQSSAGLFSLRVYGSEEIFNQNFSSIAADRNSETLTDRQRSPSQQIGFAGQWQRTFGKVHTVTAGMEARDVRGHSAEVTFNAAGPTANVDAGGRQRTIGYFGQDTFLFAPNWVLGFGGRVDTWLNSRGFSNRFPLPSGSPAANSFANRSETAFSPRVSLMHSFRHGITASASVYRAFRAPTLNELYRNFRVGNIVTNANAELTAEILTGGEAGVVYTGWGDRLVVRGNFFWSDIADPVANVTLSTTPTLITRQRQNLGVTRAVGMEIAAELRLPMHLRLSGGYILTDSTVLSFAANPALIGLQIPQVPKNQVNAQLSYAGVNWSAGIQARLMGNQFDDDQNLLPLGRAFTLDAEVSRRIRAYASVFAAAQNLFDDRYTVARTPITNIGPPILARVGIRLEWPAR